MNEDILKSICVIPEYMSIKMQVLLILLDIDSMVLFCLLFSLILFLREEDHKNGDDILQIDFTQNVQVEVVITNQQPVEIPIA